MKLCFYKDGRKRNQVFSDCIIWGWSFVSELKSCLFSCCFNAWTASSTNQSILKEISPGYSLEGLMLKLNSNIVAIWCKSQLTEKDPDPGKDWGQKEKGKTENEMVEWHHQLNGHEPAQSPGDDDGQGNLACCSPWYCKESDTTEGLNHNSVRHPNWNHHHVSSKIPSGEIGGRGSRGVSPISAIAHTCLYRPEDVWCTIVSHNLKGHDGQMEGKT